MKKISFLKWASTSLPGNIVLLEIFTGVPLFFAFLYLNYSEGTLTVMWAVLIAIVSGLAAAVIGVLGWFTVAQPLIRRRESKRSLD